MDHRPATIPNPTAARITGGAAIVAPLLLLTSTIAFITDGNGVNDGHTGGAISVMASLALLLAFVGIVRSMEPLAPTAAPIVAAVVTIGCAAGVAFGVDAIYAAEWGRDAVDAVTEESPLTLLAFLPWGLFFPFGTAATGVLMWRTGAYPRVTAALVVAGGLLFVTARPARVDALAVLTDCVLLLALVPIGWALLSRPRTTTTTSTPAPTAA